jgi:hypothetical protein
MTERDVERPRSGRVEAAEQPSPVVEPAAQQSIREMENANQRGTTSALRQFDGGNAPTISDSTVPRRAPGGRDTGEPMEEPRTVSYTVKKGDTLWSISRGEQTDVGAQPQGRQVMEGIGSILMANPRLNPDRPLREGQRIEIPEEIRTGIRPHGREIPGAPTGLVLDDFNSRGGNVIKASHGEVLANGFNALGFNVLRAQVAQEGDPRTGRANFTGTMERAANYIEANREKFTAGSFVNASFGTAGGDLTYRQVSTMLRMDVNAGNVEAQKEEILTRLDRVANGRNPQTDQPDRMISARDRSIAQAAVNTNRQIERIQGMGVEVIHAAGNDGADRLDINFLRATNIRGVAPDGTALKFSAVGSHTVPGPGIMEFHQVDKNNVAAFIDGRAVTFPVDPEARYSRRDHMLNPDRKKLDGDRMVVPTPRNYRQNFDLNARNNGYEQRVYNVGPKVDFVEGTSYAPLFYVARSRNVERPPEP